MSSAYLRLLIFLPKILILACASFNPTFHMMNSVYKLNKQGDDILWYTTFSILNQSIFPCLVLNVASWSAYRLPRRQIRLSDILISLRIFHILLWSTQSLLHSQWSRSRYFFWNSLAFSMIQQMLAIWSLVPLAFLNPAWHLEVLGSRAIEAWLGGFWALLC